MAGSDRLAAYAEVPPLELALDELLERLDGARDLLLTLAELQLTEAPKAVGDIRRSLDAGDAPGAEQAAHRLAGSLIVFGADDAVAAARAVEHLSRDGRLADATGRFPALEFEVQRVLAALDRVIQSPHS